MGKLLTILNGAADQADKGDLTEQQQADFMATYVLVEADSHDAAVQMLGGHPHLALMHGNSIEVIECPAIPG